MNTELRGLVVANQNISDGINFMTTASDSLVQMSDIVNRLTEEEAIAQGYTVITTADDLNNIRNDLTGKYILMNDIDLSVYDDWDSIEDFSGTLDGNGYIIKNLTSTTNGLFASSTRLSVEIKNLGLENVDINVVNSTGSDTLYVGGLMGESDVLNTITLILHTQLSWTLILRKKLKNT